MKKLTRFTLALAIAAALTAPCFAATPNWNGTWKRDQARSHLASGTVTITQTGPEAYRLTNGTLTENMTCDGKPHPALAGRDMTCKKLSGGGYEMSTLLHGKVLERSHVTFSRNGKKQYTISTRYLPNGKTATSHSTQVRLSGTTGLAGKWRQTKYSTTSPGIMVISVSGDTIHFHNPAGKSTLTARLDGTPAAPTGPNVPKNLTVSVKKISPRELHETVHLNGKVIAEETDTLSANSKTLTEVSWTPSQPNEKEIEVYKRQ